MLTNPVRSSIALVLIGVCFGVAAEEAPVTEFAPVGLTTLETTGGGGFHQESDRYLFGAQHRHRHCQQAFGPTARMCSSRDVLQVPSTAFGLRGWIAPAGIGAAHTGKGMKFYDTATGVVAPDPGRLSCDQHLTVRNPVRTGLLLDDSGKIRLAACEESHPVVCCASVDRPAF